MKNLLLLLGTILISNAFFSQTDRMDVNSINAKVTGRGVMFYDTTTGAKPGFEVIKDSGTSTIYSSSLVFTGISRGDTILRGVLDFFGNDTLHKLMPGPLTVNAGSGTGGKRDFGPASITASESVKWDKVFCVTRIEIEIFKQWFECKKDPGCNELLVYPGYAIPQSIMTWPAHGDVAQFQDYYMAPFFDKNSDGDYNPNDGDFPCIKGDKYCWYVINDKLKPYSPIGLEIHVEVYAFDKDISNPVDRTLFVGYDIINRSTMTVDSFRVSQFADLDIGCGGDDYVGSFPNLNAVFGYNGDNDDNNCSGGALPFGKRPPAHGVTVLNRTLIGGMYFNNSSGNMGNPSNLVDLNNYLNNKWKNGVHLNYGGNGYPSPVGTSTTGVLTNYIFPDPAPSGMLVWNETSEGNPAGDRRIIANTGGVTLTPGDVYELDLAFTFSRADTGNHLASVAKLKMEIPIIQAFYNDSILPCTDSLTGTLAQKEIFKDKVSVFPNPFKGSLAITLEGE